MLKCAGLAPMAAGASEAEVTVLPWHSEVSELHGSQQHLLIAAVQQQNRYAQVSIKAIIKGASLAFLIRAEWVHL